jgi:ABC-type uncharacterized transport system substrate-binding protein
MILLLNRLFKAVALFACALGSVPCAGQEVTAILSARIEPYEKAFEAFQTAYGAPVRRINLSDEASHTPAVTRVVVAFGGKAALASYPAGTLVIYCLAPGVNLDEREKRGEAVKVTMLPPATDVISRLKLLQPGLTRLGIFWASDAQLLYVNALQQVAQQWGIVIVAEHVHSLDDLPEAMRQMLRNHINGVWLPPDPVLINAQSFELFRTFSRSNDVPLYVPSGGLVDKGAVASVACGFEEIGRTAGLVVKRVLSGEKLPAIVYPEKVIFRVSLSAATEAGMTIDRPTLERGGGELQ